MLAVSLVALSREQAFDWKRGGGIVWESKISSFPLDQKGHGPRDRGPQLGNIWDRSKVAPIREKFSTSQKWIAEPNP